MHYKKTVLVPKGKYGVTEKEFLGKFYIQPRISL